MIYKEMLFSLIPQLLGLSVYVTIGIRYPNLKKNLSFLKNAKIWGDLVPMFGLLGILAGYLLARIPIFG